MTNCARIEHEIGTVSVYQEAAAERLLASSEFQAQWQNLFEKCPWGTCFQTSAFVYTWYRCYGELYQPLLLVRFAANGQLDGLLTLAVDRTTGDVTFAGAHHAEYRVWLALPGEQTFIVDALQQLRRLGFVRLCFNFSLRTVRWNGCKVNGPKVPLFVRNGSRSWTSAMVWMLGNRCERKATRAV